jgi:hypothetical protein
MIVDPFLEEKTAKTNPAGKQTQKFNHRNLKKYVINKLFRANFSREGKT